MTLDELLLEWSYRSEKGYPSLDSPSDVLLLEQILKELNLPTDEILLKLEQDKPGGDDIETPGTDGMEDSSVEKSKEKKEFSKKDLIDLINKTDISNQQLSDLSNRISNLYLTGPINTYLDNKAIESNISKGQILKFRGLLKSEEIQKEFSEYISNPVSLDLSKTNFTELIPNIPSNKLLALYREMGSAIVGNVSIGPGEILFSILFNNVKKRDSKGDLDVGGKNVELKASTRGAGAVVAKGYNRGDWSTTKRKGRFEEFIKELNMTPENETDSLKALALKAKWPSKLSVIYDIYTKDENFNRDIFIKGVANILSRIYTKSNWYPKGKYFDLNTYFSNQDMNVNNFIIGLSKELVEEYKNYEGFDGMLLVDKKGNMSYLEGQNIINNIGQNIGISGPSDDVPRLRLLA